MQNTQGRTGDNALFRSIAEIEDLAEKKAKIYSRLLTETNLAEQMETLAVRHANRKQTLLAYAGVKGGEIEK